MHEYVLEAELLGVDFEPSVSKVSQHLHGVQDSAASEIGIQIMRCPKIAYAFFFSGQMTIDSLREQHILRVPGLAAGSCS